jgi:hypothetical protein
VWSDRTFLQVIRSDRAAMHEVEIGADELREGLCQVNRIHYEISVNR